MYTLYIYTYQDLPYLVPNVSHLSLLSWGFLWHHRSWQLSDWLHMDSEQVGGGGELGDGNTFRFNLGNVDRPLYSSWNTWNSMVGRWKFLFWERKQEKSIDIYVRVFGSENCQPSNAWPEPGIQSKRKTVISKHIVVRILVEKIGLPTSHWLQKKRHPTHQPYIFFGGLGFHFTFWVCWRGSWIHFQTLPGC